MNLVQTQPRSIGSLPPVGPLVVRSVALHEPRRGGGTGAARDGTRRRDEPRRQRRRVRLRLGRHGLRHRRGEPRTCPGGRAAPARPDGAGHQGRHHAADPLRLVAHVPPLGLRGLAATDGRRGDRPLPDPPPGPPRPPGRRRRHAHRPARRGQDPRGRRVEPHPGAGGRTRRTPSVPDRVEPARVLGAAPRPAARRHVRCLHALGDGRARLEPTRRRTPRHR